jgi:DNA-binding transcriptional MerR regulator
METDEEQRWAVGPLAAASGLTVRTLHHWDEIGLLVPSERTGAGHRRYTAADVRRLYRILALRRLGLPLADVAGALAGDGPDLRHAVEQHLRRVEGELEATTRLRDRLAGLLQALDAGGQPSGAELIQTIEVMTMHEQYYSAEQLQQLAERRDALGDEGMQRVQDEWAELIEDMRREHEAGTDPGDPRVRALGARWQALLEQFTGGDPGIQASLQRMYEEQGSQAASHGMVDPELMAYAARARQAGSG